MTAQVRDRVSFAAALRFWLKLGCISFGGPAGQIAIMHEELVERRRWISERRYLHALNYCMLLPGPEAQQLATYLGWLMHGSVGGLLAGILFVLPSLLLIIALACLYLSYGDQPVVLGLLYGVKPAVVAIVLFAAWRIGTRVLRNALLVCVAVLAFVAVALLHVPFPWVVLTAALIGAVGGHFMPQRFASGSGHAAPAHPAGPAIIDDDTPPPAHARTTLGGLVLRALLALFIWYAGLTCLRWLAGSGTVWPQMAWFFTKAALLTFGGAYAVLPYVYQGAVMNFGWLSAQQMMDGLALGETTPGPLIMIVAFVGYVGSVGAYGLDGNGSFVAGAVGAVVATFFTFLPSFAFVLVGAPIIEATRGEVRLTAPLMGITAAVVGVIVSLAWFFAGHVLWPQGYAQAPDVFAAALCLLAALALLRYRVGIIRVIAASAVLGLVWHVLA